MNGYLVTGSCALDDVPLALLGDERDAERFAHGVSQRQVCDVAYEVLERDVSVVYGVDVTVFVDGRPVASRRLVEWPEPQVQNV